MDDSLPPARAKATRPTFEKLIARYDLAAMVEEVRDDFTPELGSQRLLKQSDISARFRKRLGNANRPAA